MARPFYCYHGRVMLGLVNLFNVGNTLEVLLSLISKTQKQSTNQSRIWWDESTKF
jgi:hypothetical protein